MSWRVKSEDLLIEVGKLFGSKVGLQKLNYEVTFSKLRNLFKKANFSSFQTFSITQVEIGSIGSVPASPEIIVGVGVYKGERVSIKKILKKKVKFSQVFPTQKNNYIEKLFYVKVEITSALLWELKKTRDVNHENTVRFVYVILINMKNCSNFTKYY